MPRATKKNASVKGKTAKSAKAKSTKLTKVSAKEIKVSRLKSIRPTRKHFNYLLFSLVIASMILFIVEMTCNLSEHALHIIEYVHLAVLVAFIIDLYLEYRRIGNFKKFIKKYWFEILIMIVFSSLGRIFRVVRELKYLSVVGEASEEVAKTSRILMFAKANHHLYHFKNAFKKVKSF